MQVQDQQSKVSTEESRKLWLEAVDALIENTELKQRIEFLERQIAVNAFAGFKTH